MKLVSANSNDSVYSLVAVKSLYPQVKELEVVKDYFPDYEEGKYPPKEFFYPVSHSSIVIAFEDTGNLDEKMATQSNQRPAEAPSLGEDGWRLQTHCHDGQDAS